MSDMVVRTWNDPHGLGLELVIMSRPGLNVAYYLWERGVLRQHHEIKPPPTWAADSDDVVRMALRDAAGQDPEWAQAHSLLLFADDLYGRRAIP